MTVFIKVNEHIYQKDPATSELGQKIISGSIALIDELGFEAFTFRKLSQEIDSTEASIYRYFENKHKLLLYLITWYWGWMIYRLSFIVANIPSAEERLRRAVQLLAGPIDEDNTFPHINEALLNRIVIAEAPKAYLHKAVDQNNKEGAFAQYKQLVANVSDIIKEVNPSYKYARMLVSTMIEGAHLQRYFAVHLPRLTDSCEGEDAIVEFYKEMVMKTITN